jgi:hypothetical protein
VDASALNVYGKWDWNKWTTTSGRFGYSWYSNANGNLAASGNPISLDPLSIYSGSSRTGTSELYSLTLTQAFNVWKDTLVRLEWRRDWTPTSGLGFGNPNVASRDDMRGEVDTIAVNVVYSF